MLRYLSFRGLNYFNADRGISPPGGGKTERGSGERVMGDGMGIVAVDYLTRFAGRHELAVRYEAGQRSGAVGFRRSTSQITPFNTKSERGLWYAI